MTEGLIDAIILMQNGIPAISKSSGATYWDNDWLPLFKNIKRIYYIEDNDSAGRIASRLLSNGKVDFILGATHHGFKADASEVMGELEQIINEIRLSHPDATVD